MNTAKNREAGRLAQIARWKKPGAREAFRKALEKRRAAKILSGYGAEKGGHARRDALSPQRRSEIASTAAQARWGNGVSRISAVVREGEDLQSILALANKNIEELKENMNMVSKFAGKIVKRVLTLDDIRELSAIRGKQNKYYDFLKAAHEEIMTDPKKTPGIELELGSLKPASLKMAFYGYQKKGMLKGVDMRVTTDAAFMYRKIGDDE